MIRDYRLDGLCVHQMHSGISGKKCGEMWGFFFSLSTFVALWVVFLLSLGSPLFFFLMQLLPLDCCFYEHLLCDSFCVHNMNGLVWVPQIPKGHLYLV